MIKKRMTLLVTVIALAIVSIGGISYAIFKINDNQEGTNELSATSCLSLTITGKDALDIENAYPIKDEKGLLQDPYKFNVKNNCDYPVTINLGVMYLDNKSTLVPEQLKAAMNIVGESPEAKNLATYPVLKEDTTKFMMLNDTLDALEDEDYEYRMWVDYYVESLPSNANINLKVVIVSALGNVSAASTKENEIKTWMLNGKDGTILGEIIKDNPKIGVWTIPGQQTNYMGSMNTFDVNTTYDKYYWTYGTGYEVVNNRFNLTGVSTLKYDTNYNDLVGKFIAYNSAGNVSNSTDTQKTTTNLSQIYYIHHVTENKVYYETYYLMTFNSSQANQEWTYAEDVEQVGTYSNSSGMFNLINTTKINYQNNKEDFVGKLLPFNSASNNYAASPALTNKTTLYEVVEAADTYIVYHYPTESTIGATKDDYGMSYYFRGNVENNYVVFANMCWRIVRIDGLGNVKLALYNYNPNNLTNPCVEGLSSGAFARYDSSANGLQGLSEFNSSSIKDTANGTNRTAYNYNAGIGFMFGTPNSNNYSDEHANDNKSTILTNLMTWYDKVFSTSDKEKIADTIWCNDKRLPENTLFNPGNYTNTNLNVGYTNAYGYYRTSERFASSTSWSVSYTTKPSLMCGSTKDDNKISKFTASDTEYGNAKLNFNNEEYKIGLLTADEVVYAGSRLGSNNSSYYLTNNTNKNYYWTSSPSYFNGSYAVVWYVYYNGYLYIGYGVFNAYGLRPSVSLKSTASITTRENTNKGTRTNPYIVN